MAAACWRCEGAVDGLFCLACQSLQPPPSGYFALFGLPEALSLDAADLQTRFYALTRQLHPDRFTRRDPREQQYSLAASSLLNDGFRVLRDPVERAEYVLTRHGLEISEQRSGNVPPELLEEVFELNMALEELRSGDASARPALESAKSGFEAMLASADADLARLGSLWDATRDASTLASLRGVLNRRRYIRNLVRDVNQALAS